MTSIEIEALASELLQDTLVNQLASGCGSFIAAQSGYPYPGNEQILYNPTSKCTDAVQLANMIYASNQVNITLPEEEYIFKAAKKILVYWLRLALDDYWAHEDFDNLDTFNYGE